MESQELRAVTDQVVAMRREIDELRERVSHLETGKRGKHHLMPSGSQQPRSPAGGAGPRA